MCRTSPRLALAIGSPAFFKARNGLELRQLRATPDATPPPERTSSGPTTCSCGFSIVGTAAEGATITANVLSRQSAARRWPDLAVQRQWRVRTGLFQMDLPIGSMAHGEYLIAIDVSHGAGHVQDAGVVPRGLTG